MPLSVFFNIITATFFWGLNFHLGKYALQFLSPNSVAFFRFAISALGLLVFWVFMEKPNWNYIIKKWKFYVALSIVGIFAYNYFFYIAMQSTSAINASLIVAFNPVLTTIYTHYAFKQKINRFQILGMIMSLIGVFIIISKLDWEIVKNMKFASGDILMLFVTSTFVFYNVYNKKWVSEASSILTSVMITWISLPIFALTFYIEQPIIHFEALPNMLWGAIVLMSIGGSVLGAILWNNAIRSVNAEVASVFVNTIPLFAILTSPLFGDFPTIVQLLGGLLIIAGVLTVAFGKKIIMKSEKL